MKNKLKTNKSIAKRVKVTGTKKLLRKKQKQNHFSARYTGEEVIGKRKRLKLSKVNKKAIKIRLPYLN